MAAAGGTSSGGVSGGTCAVSPTCSAAGDAISSEAPETGSELASASISGRGPPFRPRHGETGGLVVSRVRVFCHTYSRRPGPAGQTRSIPVNVSHSLREGGCKRERASRRRQMHPLDHASVDG